MTISFESPAEFLQLLDGLRGLGLRRQGAPSTPATWDADGTGTSSGVSPAAAQSSRRWGEDATTADLAPDDFAAAIDAVLGTVDGE